MPIYGHKPSAYSIQFDRDGNKIEKEFRQCIHCQYVWEYKPGSGERRGFCLKCYGLLCGRPECASHECKGPYVKYAENPSGKSPTYTRVKFHKSYG
jgi:hypothetical protein